MIRIFILLLSLIGSVSAEVFSRTVAVGPGDNGIVIITDRAIVDDQLTITFTAKADYVLVSAAVSDPAKLGWKSNGGFSFTLTVSDKLERNRLLSANFFGKLRKKPADKGTGKADDKLYDWNLDGRFKVLSLHEGTGADDGRMPIGGLESDKPGGAPQSVGVATYNDQTGDFDGTFNEGGQGKYIGLYSSYPHLVDPATQKAQQLGSPESKPCPEGDGTHVFYVYFGAEDAGVIGGMAIPDIIQMNSFTANPTAAQAQADAAAKTAARRQAEADRDAAQAAKTAADGAEKLAQKALNDAIADVQSVISAQKRLDAAKANLDAAEAAERAAKTAWDKAQKEHPPNSAAYKKAEREWRQATEAAKVAKKLFENAQAALAKAKEAAANTPKVKAAQAALDAAKAAAKAATETLAQAEKALGDARLAETQAEALARRQAGLERKWKQVYDGTLVHEEGHRRICHFYADKTTDMLNHLRTWGYAPEVERAKTLGATRFREEWDKRVAAIQDADKAMQKLYDSPQGTDHGINQGNWNWGRLQ